MNIRPSIVHNSPPFNESITKWNKEFKAFAASDASVKDGVMAEH